MSNRRRLARAGALVALSALAGMACNNTQDAGPRPSMTVPDDTVAPSAPTTSTTIAPGRNIDVAFAGGQVVGGPRKEAVRLGKKSDPPPSTA